MRTAVEDLVKRLKLALNAEKTREVRVPEEPLEFLGYRIGRNYRRDTGRAYIGTRPSPASVQSLCRRVSALTERRYGLLEPERVVGRLNRLLNGWANYFSLGQVSPAYATIDRHATRRPAPVAEPQAQGEGREDGALPGQATLEGVGAHSSWSANGQLSVGARMISSESRMR